MNVLRVKDQINTANWDGMGKNNKKGHIRAWTEYLAELNLNKKLDSHTHYSVNDVDIAIGNGIPEHNPNDDLSIYTDGSKIKGRVGCGWIITKLNHIMASGHRQLPSNCSVYQAEMSAIELALSDLKTMSTNKEIPDKTIVYVDNQSTLHSLRGVKQQSEQTQRILVILKELSETTRVSLRWIRGHDNHTGNEAADAEAKLGAQTGEMFRVPCPSSFIKIKLKEKLYNSWNNRWSNLNDCRQSRELITFEPSSKEKDSFLSKSRRTIRHLTALLTGHNCLMYHTKLKNKNAAHISSNCRRCDSADETSWHLLYDCPSLEMKRREAIYNSENPKKGPDIEWYLRLAKALGIFDELMIHHDLE